MTLAIVHLGSAVAILLGWLLIAVLSGPFIGKAIRGPRFDSQGRERVGLSPTLRDAQERQARAERALRRYGRAA